MKLSGEFLRERVITITKGFYYWAIRMVQHENQSMHHINRLKVGKTT